METIKIFNNYRKYKFGINLLIKYTFIIAIIIIFIKIKINVSKINNHSKLGHKLNNINEFNEEFIRDLKSIFNEDEIIENAMMNRYTTFKIGGTAKYLVKPKIINQIIEIIKLSNKYKINYFILGNGSNLLVSDKGYSGVIILINENNFSHLSVIKKN